MMLAKKITAVTVAAAFLMSGSGHLGLEAAAQSVAATVSGAPMPVIPVGGLSTGLIAGGAPRQGLPAGGAAATVGLQPSVVLPVLRQGAAPAATAGALSVTSYKGGPAAAAAPAAARASAAPAAPAYRKAVEAVSAVVEAPGIQALSQRGADASAGDRKAAMDITFDRSAMKADGSAEVAGLETAAPVTLEPASPMGTTRRVAAEKFAARAEGGKDQSGSLIAEVGIGAAVAAVLASIVSPSFRNYMKRMGQVVLGWIGLGVKRAETPEVVAQRIIDQLNAAKPEYNRKVEQASTLAEKIAIQIRDEKVKIAELEANINALLSDKDDSNDNLATGLIQAQKNLQASVVANTEQYKLAAANLEEIKAERTRFYQEREETLARINAQLSRAKAAEIQKQMAELKGGFKVGDVKDSLDRLNDIVNGMEAEAKGSKDAAESNPDEIIKKAKDRVRNQEVLDEIARRKAEIAKSRQGGQDKAGSLIAEVGIGAAVAAVLASIFSPSFRNYMKRMGQVVLGWIGLGVKKAETPEVVAQRIIDQLNAAKPEYNRKVQQASTLTEKLAIQIRDQKAKIAELEGTITALLSDKDEGNDHLATGLIQSQKQLQASTTATEEQFKLAAANLEEIKAERTRFYQEREETLARINAQLSRAKAAEIQKQMAELKGGFKVGDVKDSLDRLNDIVNGMEAEAKGSKDAAESNPDEIIKKAKEQVKNQEVLDEIARRKADIAKKQQGGQDKAGSAFYKDYAFQLGAIGLAVWGGYVLMMGLSAATLAVPAFIGFLAGMASYLRTGVSADGSSTYLPVWTQSLLGGALGAFAGFGASLFTPGFLILGATGVAAGLLVPVILASSHKASKDPLPVLRMLGMGVAGALVGATLPVWALGHLGRRIDLRKSTDADGNPDAQSQAAAAKQAEQGKDRSGSLLAEVGIGAAVAAVLASIVSPSFRNYMKRMGQVVLGWIGLGVKRAETPEVVAQRIIDQLNAAKPEYNRKVEQASTLAEKIAIQIRDEKAKIAELETTINALLSDKDDSNDNLATGLIQAQKNLQASVVANTEQYKLAAANLEEIKAERTRFYQEREETLARINAQLSRAKAAEIQKQMAELKGGFKVGDVKDSLDRLNDIVNGMEAEAKGSKDAAESNPDEIIKKAKDRVRNQEVLDEIARRKAEIAQKQQGGQDKAGSALEIPILALIAGAVATATGRKRAGMGAIAAALGLLAPQLAWLLPLGALMLDRSERRGVLAGIAVGSLVSTAILTALVFGFAGVPMLPAAFYAAPLAATLLALLSPKGAKAVKPAAKTDGGVN